MVIVAAWCVEDYQVIRLAGSSPRGLRAWPTKRSWMSRRWENPAPAHAGFAGDGHGFHRHQIECIDEIAKLAGTGEMVAE